jgi:hypothetical protein
MHNALLPVDAVEGAALKECEATNARFNIALCLAASHSELVGDLLASRAMQEAYACD